METGVILSTCIIDFMIWIMISTKRHKGLLFMPFSNHLGENDTAHFCRRSVISWSGAGLVYSTLFFMFAWRHLAAANMWTAGRDQLNKQRLFVERGKMSHSSQHPDKNTSTLFLKRLRRSRAYRMSSFLLVSTAVRSGYSSCIPALVCQMSWFIASYCIGCD